MQRCHEFDLVHDLSGGGIATLSPLFPTPVLVTICHEYLQNMPDFFAPNLVTTHPRVKLLAADPEDIGKHLSYVGTVAMDAFVSPPEASTPVEPNAQAHLVYAGCFDKNPGVLAAIEVAKRANKPIVLLGKPKHFEWFKSHVMPLLDTTSVRWIAEAQSERADLAVSQAYALVHVGNANGMQKLVIRNAQRHGVPVVALSECPINAIKQGINGYSVEMIDAAVQAIATVANLDRSQCRESVKVPNPAETVAKLVELYELIVAQHMPEEHRPWGYYRVLADEPDHKVKRLVVYPGKRLSLQRHRHRSEHWFVLEGQAMVVHDEEEVRLLTGQSIEIPKGCWHRVRNPGQENLAIIEIQTGDSFDENDIERAEDDYGRMGK